MPKYLYNIMYVGVFLENNRKNLKICLKLSPIFSIAFINVPIEYITHEYFFNTIKFINIR